jgi:hypothetical protein
MTQLTIENGIVQIVNSVLENSTGAFSHSGNYTIDGILTADTLHVKNIITDEGAISDIGNWVVNTEEELNGKGFTWAWGTGSALLQYRTGERLWSNASLDLQSDQSYKIDNTPVLSASSLGDSIVNSKLRTIGTLNSLKVSGDATMGDFFFVNSTFNKIGIGTEDPSAAITILENNVEISIGSPEYDVAYIGTSSNHNVSIIADGRPRITATAAGEVVIGNASSRDGLLRVNGSIYVDNLIADTRVERTSPLEFQSTRDQTIYGLGLVWSGNGAQRELLMYSDPDRLRTTESFEVAEGQSYYIGGHPVLTSERLGNSVAYSNLITVGPLNSLRVTGDATVNGTLTVSGNVTFNNLIFTDGDRSVILDKSGIGSFKAITVKSAGYEAVYADASELSIGDKTLTNRPVKVFGPLSIGINKPDPTLQFSVNGDVGIGGKRFTNGHQAPTIGTWSQGDICWNTTPLPSSFVGWVCIQTGSPGAWSGFGLIASQ